MVDIFKKFAVKELEDRPDRHPISMKCPKCGYITLTAQQQILFQDRPDIINFLKKEKGTYNCSKKRCGYYGSWEEFYIDDPFFALNWMKKNDYPRYKSRISFLKSSGWI